MDNLFSPENVGPNFEGILVKFLQSMVNLANIYVIPAVWIKYEC